MFEATAAAAQQLLDGSRATSAHEAAALSAASIPAPLILSTGGGSGAGAALPLVRCTVAFGGSAAPAVRLESRSSGSAAPTTSFAAQLCGHYSITAAAGTAQQASQAARQQIAGAIPAAPSRLAAGGSLLLRPQHAAPGWRCHPAALDATLHLGIFAAPAQQPVSGSASDGPAPARVPVAAAYFTAGGSSGISGGMWPVMQCEAAADDATIASYSLPSGSGSAAFRLQRLQSKAVRGSSEGRQPATAAPQLASYCVQAVANSPTVVASKASGPVPALILAGGSERLPLHQPTQRSSAPAATFRAAAAALRLLREGAAADSLRLSAVTAADQLMAAAGVPESRFAASLAAVSVQGLLKAAAAEAPAAAALPGCTSHSYLQPPAVAAVEPEAADLFAAPHLSRGTWLQHTLLQAEQPNAAASTGNLQLNISGGVAISGGLGSLGQLTATWLAAGQSSGSICLWGRSAAVELSAALKTSGCLLAARQCDAAAVADVAATADACRGNTTYVHAGGCDS